MKEKRRILIVDDNKSIHDDFKKILQVSSINPGLADIEKALFEEEIKDNVINYEYYY